MVAATADEVQVTTADEVQARLALRGLCHLAEQSGDGEDRTSQLHRTFRAEVEDVLQGGLKRRMARLERKVALLCSGAGAEPSTSSTPPQQPRLPAPRRPAGAAVEVQTDSIVGVPAVPQLAVAVAQALREAAKFAAPAAKDFGPSAQQVLLAEPPEKQENAVPETYALKSTLDSLGRNLAARERQIKALEGQLATCQKLYHERAVEATEAAEGLRRLAVEPEARGEVHQELLQRRRQRVAELSKNLVRTQEQAKKYQLLVQQQRAFFLQSERVSAYGQPEELAKHAAGEIMLVPPPPAMTDEKAEVWDVGSAIANPYVVDSWPFEPNVLYRRAPQDTSMERIIDEDDSEDERNRRLRSYGLRLPLHRDRDEDGPTETARSL